MAVIANLSFIHSGTIGNSIGNPRKYTVDWSTLKSLGGANTTLDVTLENLPAGAVPIAARVKHSVAFAGTTTATARMFFNATALADATLDIAAAPGSTAQTHYKTHVGGSTAGKVDAVNVFMVQIILGATPQNLTAGVLGVEIDYTVLKLP